MDDFNASPEIAQSSHTLAGCTSVCDAALHYARLGWPVFPCEPHGKAPATVHGLKDASVDPDRIRSWWAAAPEANVAIRTGSGLMVLDVDGYAGEQSIVALEQRHGTLTETIQAVTGKGRHLYYRVDESLAIRNSAGKLGPGLDVRGHGGYVIAPPSVHPNGKTYAWVDGRGPTGFGLAEAPKWLVELALASEAKGRQRVTQPSSAVRLRPNDTDGPISAGGRNDYLTRLAGAMRRKGMSAEAMKAALAIENTRRCTPPLDADEIGRIAESVARYAPEPGNVVEVDFSKKDVHRLATMDPLEYERVRQTEAKKMGVRAKALDRAVTMAREETVPEKTCPFGWRDHERWHAPVNGARLLSDLSGFFARHVVLPQGAADTLALWTTFTYVHDAARISPILGIKSATKRCGKSALLSAMRLLANRPLPTTNITPAALFRSIEQWRPTMLIDEADTFLGDANELRGMLNAGHMKDSAFIVRVAEGRRGGHELETFSVWAPKAIARIGALPDTLHDRAVEIELKRRLSRTESIEPLPEDASSLDDVRRKLLRWAADAQPYLVDARPTLPDWLDDRAKDNWRILVAIADRAGDDWSKRARKASQLLSARRDVDDEQVHILLLRDLKGLFEEVGDKAFSDMLVERLNRIEGRPWPDWRGKALTANALARLLRPFAISPSSIRINERSGSGYRVEQFKDAFDRWLGAQSTDPAS